MVDRVHWLGEQVEDAVEDHLAVRVDDVAAVRESPVKRNRHRQSRSFNTHREIFSSSPSNGVEEPEEGENDGAVEVAPVESLVAGVLDCFETSSVTVTKKIATSSV